MANDALSLGIAAAKAGDFRQAQVLLNQAIQNDPGSEEGWLWLGVSLRDPAKQEFCYQKVLTINPDNATARHALSALQRGPQAKSLTHSAARPQTVRQAKPKKRAGLLPLALVFLLGLALCALPATFLALNGNLNSLAAQLPLPFQTTPTFTPTHTFTPSPSPSPTLTPLPPSPTWDPTRIARENRLKAEDIKSQALGSTLQAKFTEALALWGRAIELDPQNDNYYSHRSSLYVILSLDEHIGFEQYNSDLKLALADINQAISLQPANGFYYQSRYEILVKMGDVQDLIVDRNALYNHASQDLNLASAWGVNGMAEQKLAYILIRAGQCTDSLPALKSLIKQPGQDLARLYELESEAYACLGQINEAIKAIDISLSHGTCSCAVYDKAIYLYQAGRKKEALKLLNEDINSSPANQGERYFLRALIYYESGQKDLVPSELDMGQANTWGRAQLLAYVQGKMAIENGDPVGGLQDLLFAESSLDVRLNLFRARVQKELAGLGEQPLVLTPSRAILEMLNKMDAPPAVGTGTATPLAGTQAPVVEPDTSLEKLPDGSTHFIDASGGYEMSIPADWLAFRPGSEEYSRLWDNEAQSNELLKRLLLDWQSNSPAQYRLYAVLLSAQDKEPADLPSMDVQYFTNDLSLDDALSSATKSLDPAKFTLLESKIIDSDSGQAVGLLEYGGNGTSSLTGEPLTLYYKSYLLKLERGLIAISVVSTDKVRTLASSALAQTLTSFKFAK